MLTLALAALAVVAPELQPRTYVSRDGGWSLSVEPRTRDGTGAAEYVLTGAGHEAYRREHPFALWDAFVTDDGRVAGYAYVGKRAEHPTGGSLHVVVLAPSGDVLLDEASERMVSAQMHVPAVPRVRGMFVQPEIERFVVRIDDGRDYPDGEEWRAYALSDGSALFRARPKTALGEPDVQYAHGLAPVPGTPLVLVGSIRPDLKTRERIPGALFQLLDAERLEVWRLELPGDYSGETRDAMYEILGEIRRDGAILATSECAFELRHVADGQRVRYAVTRAEDGWSVVESDREPYAAPEAPSPLEHPTFTPLRHAEIALGPPAPMEAEIRDVLAFGFDGESRIRFARQEQGGTSLVVLEPSGIVRTLTRVEGPAGESNNLAWFPLASPGWVAATREFHEDGPVRAWLVDENTGAARELAGFPEGGVSRVLELDAERLLVLRGEGGLFVHDIARARSNPFAAETFPAPVSEGGVTASWGNSADDVVITTDGRIVVLEIVGDLLHVLAPDGHVERTLELAEAWGQEPNYLRGLVPGPEGSVLVGESNGDPPFWRMSLDGSVVGRHDVRGADGQPLLADLRNARFAPDGRMWSTDGHEFLRLDGAGAADLVLGEAANVELLTEPIGGEIASGVGRILVQDDRTHAFHVFDARGARVTIARPRPEELDDVHGPLELGCDAEGGLHVARSRWDASLVRFAPDGTSLGIVDLGACNVCWVPGRPGEAWGVKDSVLLRLRDRRVERRIEKRADGQWWRDIEDVTVAPDGTMAVLETPGRVGGIGISQKPGRAVVARFDDQGRALSQHELPEGVRPNRIAHAGQWVLVHSFGKDPWLIDVRDGSFRRVDLATEEVGSLGLSPAGDALWLLHPAERRLVVSSLPE